MRHICNYRKLILDMYTKNYGFIIARSEIIWTQKVDTIHFYLQTDTIMTLLNIIYTLKYDSNLISLDQFHESVILYHNHPNSIILK